MTEYTLYVKDSVRIHASEKEGYQNLSIQMVCLGRYKQSEIDRVD